jgi:hypothetical protein
MERVQIRGLPKGNYQVQCKTKDNWEKLVQTILPDCRSGVSINAYYEFTEDCEWYLKSSKFEDVEEVTYDDWKEAIEIHIIRIGDFKVGDLVYITKGYFDLKEGDVRALDGFDGMHWWIKTKEYPKIFLDKDENFRHATKEEIAAYENKTTPKTEFKVGDWVTTTSKKDNWTGLGGLSGDVGKTFQIAEISDQGSIWYRKTKGGHDGALAQSLRFATLEEIVAVQSNPPKPVSDLISDYTYSNIKGKNIAIHCPTQELWDKVIALIPNCRLNSNSGMLYGDRRCITPCVFNGSYSPIEYYKGGGYQIITAEEFIAANEKKHGAEPVVRKDSWKVGDKLPAEFLNLCTYYTDIDDIHSATSTEDEEEWDSNRVVATVTSKGWACISGTGGAYYLSNKDEYPEYDHYENPKAIPASATVSASASNIMVTKDNAVVGLEVVRGRDWNYGDQDCVNGKQVVGVIVNTKDYFLSNKHSGWVRVQWKGGCKDSYEIGHGLDNEDARYDLYVYQGSTEPVQEPVTPTLSKREEEKQSQTIIISKQTNTKTEQDENIKESSIGISITEQCFITSGSYKFSKAAYIPGDEERITKGQRRQGSTVRG